METKSVCENNESEGNVLGHDEIEIVEFNCDGKGSGFARLDSDPQLYPLRGEVHQCALLDYAGTGRGFARCWWMPRDVLSSSCFSSIYILEQKGG